MPKIHIPQYKILKIELTPQLQDLLDNSEHKTLTKLLNYEIIPNFITNSNELFNLKKRNKQLETTVNVITEKLK